MDRYDQLQLLMHRWLAQINLVAPGEPFEDALGQSWSRIGYVSTPPLLPFTFPLLFLYSLNCTDFSQARSALATSDEPPGATRPI